VSAEAYEACESIRNYLSKSIAYIDTSHGGGTVRNFRARFGPLDYRIAIFDVLLVSVHLAIRIYFLGILETQHFSSYWQGAGMKAVKAPTPSGRSRRRKN